MRPQGRVLKLRRRNLLHLAVGAAGLAAVIAPTGPGGAPDIIARLIGPWLSQRLGTQFIVENRAGSGNHIGTEAVVRAAPDGYTLLLIAPDSAINATLYDKLNFNFIRDIARSRASSEVPT